MQQRVLAIDFGRGASVLVMMLVHTLTVYGRQELQTSPWFGMPIHIAGRGTAMFMVAMGFSFVLSRRQSPGYAARRGGLLLLLGYLMNALTFLVPHFGRFMPEPFIRAYGFEPPLGLEQLLYLLRIADILQLAGISFALMGLLQHWLKSRRMLLVLAFAVAASSGELRGYQPGIAGLDYACNLLWGAHYDVYFPLFPWFSVILFGMYLGKLYEHLERDPERLYTAMLRLGVPLAVFGYVLCQVDPAYHYGDFFHGGLGTALASMGIAALLFCLAHRLTPLLQRHRLGAVLRRGSERVTQLYLLQWVLICWGMGVFGYQEQNELGVLALAALVMALSFACDGSLQALWTFMWGPSFRRQPRAQPSQEGHVEPERAPPLRARREMPRA